MKAQPKGWAFYFILIPMLLAGMAGRNKLLIKRKAQPKGWAFYFILILVILAGMAGRNKLLIN